MAMKRCPDCGEKYSDSYKYCPFCEEEEILRTEKKSRGGRRGRHGRGFSPLTIILIVLILVMAGILMALLRGDKKADKPKDPITPSSGVVTPVQPVEDEPDSGEEDPDTAEDPTGEGSGVMPDEPDTTTPVTPAASSDYDKAMALPSGLTLSTTDFTLKTVGETATIRVSGGSGSYTWLSEDDGIASVDSSGKVTAISRGTINVVVTDGSKKGVCIVRCSVSGTASTTTTPGGSTSTSGGGLKTGSAKVNDAGGGVFVRAQPNTGSEKLATLVNGNSVQIVRDAGDGWYEITFSGNGGVTTGGYMKGDYLVNN